MSCLTVANDSFLSSDNRSVLVQEADADQQQLVHSRASGTGHQWVALSRVENEFIRAFSGIPEVNALYAERDSDNLLMVFVVVPEHDATTYERVVEAEELLRTRIHGDFELRVRAHQGRTTTRAVPMRTLPLFLK